MTATGRTSQIFPLRAWRMVSGAWCRTYDSAARSAVAARAFGADLLSPDSPYEHLMAEHARTFRFATRFLPGEYRESTIRLYAFFRSLDDLVDESPDDPATIESIRRQLDSWETWLRSDLSDAVPNREIGNAVAPVIMNYRIPRTLFLDFLEGLRADLYPVTPRTRDEIEQYSYQVASTVGLAMAHVFGSTCPSAVEAARRLGIAMQLTNILRDVGGDAARNRVYLPEDLLHAHGLTVSDVLDQWQQGKGPDQRLIKVLQTIAGWAEEHYKAGVAGIRLLPRDVQMPILVAARLYQQILERLKSNEYDSLRQRAATTGVQKILEARRCIFSIQQLLDEAQPSQAHGSNRIGPPSPEPGTSVNAR